IDMNLFIVDMEGQVAYQKQISDGIILADHSAEFVNSTTILYGDSSGAHLWNIYTDEVEDLSILGHHDYEMNMNNNSIFTLTSYIEEIESVDYRFDKIIEVDLTTGLKIWEVDTQSFISHNHYCPYLDSEGDVADLTHSNTVIYDDQEDIIYLSCRNTNTIYKLDHKTGDLIWALGEYGDFDLFDIDGNKKDILFYHGHALEKISNDTFIYFDNDEHNQENLLQHKSRIIEIQVDEVAKRAQIVWEWVSPSKYFSAWWGDADRLPNGNRLGTFGTMYHEGSTAIGARLVEVDSLGEIVWEMNFPKDGEVGYGVYSMDRIHFSPIIGINSTYWIKSGEEALVNWQAYNSFRNKYPLFGDYRIYFEDELVDDGNVEFSRYWQPTNLNLNLGSLEDGTYNLTIQLEDDSNHIKTQHVNLTVSEFPPDGAEKNNGYTVFAAILAFSFIITIVVIWKKRKKSLL
ncbi:MAG: aryl-sulfate sulfotransferase, partial [Candidatus Heimdallarchaeota archaeon]|nr:aryl-sulfate sulfotransferase [Candidatus Heimdallarchaeota archaeon]MCK4878304.1 aryl-sulfate sulfotransferase [Candidatus Heimdallarchaeota archaeon]